jgi:hypothetical protein
MNNTHFTRLIKANERLREFNFRKLPSTANQNLFHVDVSDDRGNRLIFKMQKEAGSPWKIIDEVLPNWVYESEPRLNEAIEDQLKA